jgi:hypothetical protein
MLPGTTISFSATKLGGSAQAMLTVSNFQGVSLNGLNAPGAMAGANPGDFKISANSCPAVLPTGSNCAITLAFAPLGAAGTAGPRSASLTINYAYTPAGGGAPVPVTSIISLTGVAQ